MIDAKTINEKRVSQGDIYKDIEYIQRIEQVKDNELEIHKIIFPYVFVLTQDCDLQQASAYYGDKIPNTADKKLLSVIVAPLYNEEQFLKGEHLSDTSINYQMQSINKVKKGKETSQYKNLKQNLMPRYHHLVFDEKIKLVNSVIDFKHYFSLDLDVLEEHRSSKFVCKVSELYRERITQRFANFLSRIGLPNPK